MRHAADFVCGLLISGLCSGATAVVLLCIYDRLRPEGELSSHEKRHQQWAFLKTVVVAIIIGLLGFTAYSLNRVFGF